MKISEIEDKIAKGEMTPTQVFTEMKQNINSALIRVIKEGRTRNVEDYCSELGWLCRCVAEVKEI